MNARRITPLFLLSAGMLLMSACRPVATAPSPRATQIPAAMPVSLATQPPAQPSSGITLDISAVAQNLSADTVAAVPAGADKSYWEAGPEYRRLTLEGYPITGNLFKAQIFIYPVADLASANPAMGKVAADLQTLLKTQQAADQMPSLPLINSAQMLHAQLQYVDFKNGRGVRFLTQFAQGLVAVNNNELIYTFQGLTSDGKYYVAAVLPVSNPQLPTGSEVSDVQTKAQANYPDYLSKMVTLLDQQPVESFTPDLNKLDALIRSMEVK